MSLVFVRCEISLLICHLNTNFDALQKNMPFWRVTCRADLEALSHALELDYL